MPESATLEEDFKSFLDACPQGLQAREIHILECLFGLKGQSPKTLEKVGSDLGLTRERVRQLRERALKRLREGLLSASPRALTLVRGVLSDRGGICDLMTLAVDITNVLPATVYDPAAYLRWLIQLSAEPEMRVLGQQTVVGPPITSQGLERARCLVQQVLSRNSGLTIEALCSELAKVWPDVDAVLLSEHARYLGRLEGREVLGGLFAKRPWSRADWAEFVLEQEGRPLHFRALTRRVNQVSRRTFSETGFNTMLNATRTFVRVGAGDFGLTKWGAKRYGRFDEVIAGYLGAQGRAVHENQIKEDLLKTYTVKESTVTAMLHWFPNKFVYFGGGYWALVGQEPGLDGELEFRIEQHLQAVDRAIGIDELEERLFRDSPPTGRPTSELRRTLYLSEKFRQVGSWANPKFLSAADVKAPPEERAVHLATRVLQDFKHPMSLGELVARISQRFFRGRYAPSLENMKMRLSANPDVEELEGLYRLRGKHIFS